MRPPGILPALTAAGTGASLALGFGLLTSSALVGRYPAWLEAHLPFGSEIPGFRLLLAAVGLFNFVLAVLVAAGYGSRALSLARHRLGVETARESEGPCRLLHERPEVWSLQLLRGTGADPGQPVVVFPLDEAAAGTISRMSNPGDILRLRWLDLPSRAGGPTLLSLFCPMSTAQRQPISSTMPAGRPVPAGRSDRPARPGLEPGGDSLAEDDRLAA